MTETQIAVFSGVLLLAAIAFFLFLGFLWGQRRGRPRQNIYDPQQAESGSEADHHIELSPSAVRPTPEQTPDQAHRGQTNTSPSISTQRNDNADVSGAMLGRETMSSLETMSNLETMSVTDLKVKSKLYHYIAHVKDVYDGDTITVDIDMGMGLWQRDVRIRLWRVNTSEVRGDERERGLAVRDFVRNLILGRDILLRTILDKRGQDRTGKYGRLLGEILVENNNGRMLNVNQLLLDKGLATPVAPDGSRAAYPANSPQPANTGGALESTTQAYAEFIACRYCGETRSIDKSTGQITTCTNCFDDAYSAYA